MIFRTAIAGLALLGSASVAVAQAEGQFRSVEDMDVVNAAGEEIGEVEEILIGQDGMPATYLVDVGGFLGLGDHEVAVALDELSLGTDGFETALTKEEFEALPEWGD